MFPTYEVMNLVNCTVPPFGGKVVICSIICLMVNFAPFSGHRVMYPTEKNEQYCLNG